MKKIPILMISSILACGAASAQTPGPATAPTPPAQSTMPPQDNTSPASPGSSGMSMSDKHAAMKSCIAQQQQSNSGMTKADAKRACKAQMKSQG
jgi:hypothetical protein